MEARVKVLRLNSPVISTQSGNSTATDAKHAKEIEVWSYLATLRPSRSLR